LVIDAVTMVAGNGIDHQKGAPGMPLDLF
jgi:hypothetical protein